MVKAYQTPWTLTNACYFSIGLNPNRGRSNLSMLDEIVYEFINLGSFSFQLKVGGFLPLQELNPSGIHKSQIIYL